MDSHNFNRLRTFYHSLLEQQRVLNNLDTKLIYIEKESLDPLVGELSQITEEFHDLFPPFNPSQYLIAMARGGQSYNIISIKTHTAMIIGRLKIAIDRPNETPITEKREFGFISDSNLRAIIERDYSEIQRAFIAQCWKSVIILSGGTIEAILTDLIITNEAKAKSSNSAPKEPDITRWDLSQLIKVAVELKLVSIGVEKLSDPVREYRNLVHPGVELRNRLRFDAEEAKIAMEVLNIVYRDLFE